MFKSVVCKSCNRVVAYDVKGKRYQHRKYSICPECGRLTCDDCYQNVKGRIVCRKCRDKERDDENRKNG